jgi:hypothetical protein
LAGWELEEKDVIGHQKEVLTILDAVRKWRDRKVRKWQRMT